MWLVRDEVAEIMTEQQKQRAIQSKLLPSSHFTIEPGYEISAHSKIRKVDAEANSCGHQPKPSMGVHWAKSVKNECIAEYT